jgi:hypothetical protein
LEIGDCCARDFSAWERLSGIFYLFYPFLRIIDPITNAPNPTNAQAAGSGTTVTVYNVADEPKVEPEAPALAES